MRNYLSMRLLPCNIAMDVKNADSLVATVHVYFSCNSIFVRNGTEKPTLSND